MGPEAQAQLSTAFGGRCSFDAFLTKYKLEDPALAQLALIVRGADTDRLELAPECAGLLAISMGMGRVFLDDQTLLERAMVMYDALYAWCQGERERHGWSYPS